MRTIEVNLVESVVYPGEELWQVKIWFNDNQSMVIDLSKDELQHLHIQTTQKFMEKYGQIYHS